MGINYTLRFLFFINLPPRVVFFSVFYFLFFLVSFSQPTNINFQTGNTTGWSLLEAGNGDSFTMSPSGTYSATTQYSVLSTGAAEANGLPITMTSPLGGNFLRVGDVSAGGAIRKLSQTYSVTGTSSALNVSYAIALQDGNHPCNEQPFFNFIIKDQLGNPITGTREYDNICQGAVGPSFSNSGNGIFYSNWNTRAFDLSPYIGTNITIELMVSGCIATQGAHFGYMYFDAELCSTAFTSNVITIDGVQTTLLQPQSNISICGTSTTNIVAPLGASGYTWTGPGITGTSSQSVSITSSGVYTLLMDKPSACSPTTAVSFSVGPNPTITVIGTPTLCGTSSGVLFANGAANYTWTPYSTSVFPIGGLSPTITVSPTVTTTYTVTGALNGCINSTTYTVFHSTAASPTLAIAGNTAACSGSSTTFTGSGANTYTWTSGSNVIANTATITVSPTVASSYVLTGMNASTGCFANLVKNISVFTNSILISPFTNTLCEGANITLYVGGAQSYTWNPSPISSGNTSGSNLSFATFSPTTTTTFTVAGINPCGTFSAAATVSVLPISGTISSNPSFSICSGSSASLTASGGTSYTWSPAATLSATNTPVVVASPTTSTTYYMTLTNATGCFRTYNKTVTVYTSSISALASSSVICRGNSTTLSASGAQTYTWSTGSVVASISVSPSVTTTYTLSGTNPCGTFSAVATISVNFVSPTVTSNPSFSICSGNSTSLTASGGTSYTWSPGATLSSTTSANVVASPTSSTVYSLTAKNATGCIKTNTILVSVSSSYSVSSSATPTTMCSGNTATLSANAFTSAGPTFTYCYGTYATGTTAGDYISSVKLGTLINNSAGLASPNYTVYPQALATTTLVAGNTYTLNLTAGTYSVNDLAGWIDFNQNGVLGNPGEKLGEVDNLAATPASANIVFTVPLSALNGNTRLRIREMDHSTINDMDPCLTQSSYGETEDYIITISGGVGDVYTHSWSPGSSLSSSTGSVVVASPSITTIYTITSTNSFGCSKTNTLSLSVDGNAVSISPSTSIICNGASAILTASGASTYTWSTGATTPSITVTPTTTTIYSLSAMNAQGCVKTNSISVSVAPNYTVLLSSTQPSICSGGSSVLSASGASNYTWSPANNLSSATGSSVTASPTVSTIYTVTAISSSGCSNTFTQSLSVYSNSSSISLSSSTICIGEKAILTGSGASTYTWNTGANSSTISVSPASSAVYSLSSTSAEGCAKTMTISLFVVPAYTVSLSSSQTSICAGGSAILSASGASSYTWAPLNSLSAVNGNTVLAFPNTTTVFTLTAANSSGCLSTYTQSLLVYSNFSLSVNTPGLQNCAGNDVAMEVLTSPAGVYNYSWYPNNAINVDHIYNPVFNSSSSGNYNYTVSVSDQNGCIQNGVINIAVVTCGIKIYSGFSPNGDGHNDTWIIDGIDDENNNEVIILNKWGQTVWSVKNYNNDDQVFKGNNKTGEALTDGTYYYIVITADKTFKGRVELIR